MQNKNQKPKQTLCQAIGRVSGRKEGSWGISVEDNPTTRSFQVMLRGDGQIEVGPTAWTKKFAAPELGPLPTPDGFRPEEFNTLTVARQGRMVTVFLNGKQVGKPLTLKQAMGPCECGLVGEQHGKVDVRADFQRFTIWELP